MSGQKSWKFANVGKTTCSIELATALARHYGKRTLVVDLDPQASATFYVMEQTRWKEWRQTRGTTSNLFEREEAPFPIRHAIVTDVLQERSTVFGFDLLPSDPNLVDVDLQLTDFVGYTILQRYFDAIQDEYDYIICDCPPNFNPVTKNSLWASNAYIVPTVPDFLSTYGIRLLRRSVNKLFAPTSPSRTPTTPAPVFGGIISKIAWKPVPFDGTEGKAFLSLGLGEAGLPELLTPWGSRFWVGTAKTPPLARVMCASLGYAPVLSRKHCLNPIKAV